MIDTNRKHNTFITHAWLYIIAILLSIIFIFPLYYAVVNSLRAPVSLPVLFPQKLIYSNYSLAVTMLPDFWKYFKNTILLVLADGIPCFIFNIIYGFAFARLRAPGKNFWFALVLAQTMIPAVAIQIPQYMIFRNIGFVDTYWIWVVGQVGGSAIYIFMYRQFFAGIPKGLEDAARIDGCSTPGMLFRIFLPLSLPVIAVVTFLSFCSTWGDFIGPMMYLRTENWPLAAAMLTNSFYILNHDPRVPLEPVTLAAAVMLMVPVLIAFFITQKYIIQGIVTTGIKG